MGSQNLPGPISGSAIRLAGALSLMARATDGLAVAWVEPQRIVEADEAPDVVDLGCCRHPSSLLALHAEGMGRQVRQPQAPPGGVVASDGSAASVRTVEASARRCTGAEPAGRGGEPGRGAAKTCHGVPKRRAAG